MKKGLIVGGISGVGIILMILLYLKYSMRDQETLQELKKQDENRYERLRIHYIAPRNHAVKHYDDYTGIVSDYNTIEVRLSDNTLFKAGQFVYLEHPGYDPTRKYEVVQVADPGFILLRAKFNDKYAQNNSLGIPNDRSEGYVKTPKI